MALKEIARKSKTPIHFVYPVHLNPNVHGPVHKLLDNDPHFTLVPPLDYLSLVNLMKRSALILTDSGGIQKEAYWLKVPCITLRDETEWVETVDAGWNYLAGTEMEQIVQAVNTFRPPANAREASSS